MRHLFMLIAGAIVGAVAGAALIFANPLIGPGDGRIDDLDRALRYDLPEAAIVLTHSQPAFVPVRPDGVEELWERTVRKSALGLIRLSSSDGSPAIASRVLVPSERTELLTAGVIVDDVWLVTLPGEGSLYVLGESNVWPVAKDTLVSVSLLRRAFRGPRDYVATAGLAPDGRALVVGATGEFANREGRAVERYRIESFTRDKGFGGVSAELRFVLDPLQADGAG
ncbi:MAG: hypothetical protein LOD94_14580 [Gammaproteobacteria bacterium]|nr:hypothetical protein [Gammaproteobacteria bacterium]